MMFFYFVIVAQYPYAQICPHPKTPSRNLLVGYGTVQIRCTGVTHHLVSNKVKDIFDATPIS